MRTFNLFIPVKPVPASRPRVTRYGAYYTKTYTDFIQQTKKFLATLRGKYPPESKKIFFVTMEFICYKPKQPANVYPIGDVDNFLKGPLDMFTKMKKFWDDDVQVVACLGMKRYKKPEEDFGVRVRIYEYDEHEYERLCEKLCGVF